MDCYWKIVFGMWLTKCLAHLFEDQETEVQNP